MKTLSPGYRKQLERTVVEARDIAETGARIALEALAVHHHESYTHMDSHQRTLRRRLRAHARHLGDRTDARSGRHTIDHLVHECAYEYWHGMLFARFLEQNHLLIETKMGVPITLDECEELAKEEGADKWKLAARYAHHMLPQIFRPDHPVFEVQLPREYRLKLERLVEGLPAEVFSATDALGWVYQFWQSKMKEEINRSEVKIGADELPAVTQLFTEPYMVEFLLHNSLGAWWVGRHPNRTCPVDLTYLRLTEQGLPASGAFEGWPNDLSEMRLLDPCCGSGHFLVAAFLLLVPMRMARESLSPVKAIDAVLRENLHGLELDPRCVALAAFSLALAAWTYPGAGGYRRLPELNLACPGLAPNTTKDQWLRLAELAAGTGGMPPKRDLFGVEESLLSAPLRNSLSALYDLFEQGPALGSLIDPSTLKANLFQSSFQSVRALLKAALEQERTSDEQTERAVAARGMARAAELLMGRYTLIATNVPFLARGRQGEKLRRFCERYYPEAKNDLATVFLERCLKLCAHGGTASLVLPQNWLFLSRYQKLRKKLLKLETWHLLARLGEGGFDSSAAAGAFVALLILSRSDPNRDPGGGSDEATAAGTMYGLDVSECPTASEKSVHLVDAEITGVEQLQQLKNPDAVVTLETVSDLPILDLFAECFAGVLNGDSPRFQKRFWEVVNRSYFWTFQQTTVDKQSVFGGLEMILYYDKKNGHLREDAKVRREKLHDSDQRGNKAWGRWGVGISQMRVLPCALYVGETFDSNVAVMCPYDQSLVLPIWTYCRSEEYHANVRRIDQKLNVTNATLTKVPFDLDRWAEVAKHRYPNGLPWPYSNDPTQWIFHGHPCGSVVWDETEKRTAHGRLRTDTAVLQTALARLLGYRWPAEQDVGMKLANEQREWVHRSQGLFEFADTDGVVCIPSVRGEPPAADRLFGLLAAAFGDAWNESVLAKLLAETESSSLDDWLRNRFFEDHCKLFHHRPFLLHIWDGRRRDGFHALVNYHKLVQGDGKGRQLLESLTYSYLGDWIARQQEGVKRGEGGAEDRLTAALELQKRLVAILQGEPPFDIFIRWKPIEEQPLGWEPDINDGVRLNIRPFMALDLPGGKRGAGILRAKPNIHWRKDRGKEPVRDQVHFPWFWKESKFTGERVNDVHLTNGEKRAAREAARLTATRT